MKKKKEEQTGVFYLKSQMNLYSMVVVLANYI